MGKAVPLARAALSPNVRSRLGRHIQPLHATLPEGAAGHFDDTRIDSESSTVGGEPDALRGYPRIGRTAPSAPLEVLEEAATTISLGDDRAIATIRKTTSHAFPPLSGVAMYRHLLVPLDGTDLSTEISISAVEFARLLGARITFFHAQPNYSAALDGEAEIVRITSPAKFAYAFEGRVRELLAKAEAGARAFGVRCGSSTAVSDSPARAIITAAREGDCDLIYMASHGRRTGIGMMLGSQTLKVLVYAGMPVLVVTNSTPPAQAQAIDVILDEHRSLAAVLHALLNVLDSGRDMREASNAELARGIMDYLHAVSVTQHRPKEEEYLLPRLRDRSSRYDPELAAMTQHNEDDRQLLDRLATAVERLLAGENCLAEAREAAVRCERSVWEHMERVEGVIVPAARYHLLPDDWEAINTAFSELADPRFGKNTATEFRRLFSRIVNLAPRSDAGG